MLFTFETNPINVTTRNATIDYFVSLALEPVEVTYDNVSIVTLLCPHEFV